MPGIAVLALLAAVAQPVAADAEYPLDAVLDAFATACSGAENTDVNMASAAAAGWERLPADADTPVTRLVRQGREALAAQDPEAEMLEGGEFRRQVAGRTLYLTVSTVRLDDMTARGCRVFDFAAPRAPTAAALERWAVRPPLVGAAPVGAAKFTWNPGLKPGHMEMEVIFAPPGTQPVPGIDVSGLALIASVLEL